jgi:hypothetical protein
LLAATEDWNGAKTILEFGSGIGDGDEMDGAEEHAGENSFRDPVNGHSVAEEVNDTPRPRANSFGGLLAGNLLQLPDAATLQRPVPEFPPQTRHERFEQALQLRLTQLALIEHVDGPENAGEKWVEVFSWVAARKGLGEESGNCRIFFLAICSLILFRKASFCRTAVVRRWSFFSGSSAPTHGIKCCTNAVATEDCFENPN